ncbi:hypothetical protein OIU80_19775 [Flavobacterium sp. LS1R47]|uniref:Uncharacterized protein n=1 Tax=Flavobacterium frigoritolerans TaxID=2987686 RepID=A0A9X3CAE5_9FLAO|nr:hypothetical protein [Flavobacterium frigoritolerans]MCV9934526.1 hypothetical protein [Flavobacterium frigoritolerans]
MDKITIITDPISKTPPITIFIDGRIFEKESAIRNLKNRENVIVIDDVEQDEESSEKLEVFQNNVFKWFELYFPKYSNPTKFNQLFISDRQNIKLGVRKRYQKVPRIQFHLNNFSLNLNMNGTTYHL